MTDASFNQTLLGQNSPRLHRENNAGQVTYPYLVSDLVSITSNQFGAQYYFYYFDLKIEQAPVYCSSDAHAVSVTVDNTTGINSASEASLMVYPNPADQLLSIRSSVANGRVSLMDATGRIVKEQTIQTSTNMNVSDLSAGVYMLRVASENSSKVMRVVIQ
jgi:hypothetical protein